MGGLAGGAEAGIEDALGIDAPRVHLTAIGFGQIQLVCPGIGIPFRKHRSKLLSDIESDLIAAGADTRADGGVEVGGVSFEVPGHFLHGAFGDLGGRSTPAGMDSSDGAVTAVQQQDRDAVSGPNTNAGTELIRDKSVALTVAIPQAARVDHAAGMSLAKSDIGCGIAFASPETVALPNELLERITTIDAVWA